MKILCAFGKYNYGDKSRGTGYEYTNFLPAFHNLGYEVEFFELWDRSAYTDFADLNWQFLQKIESTEPDIVFCITMTTELWLETLEIAQKTSHAIFIHWGTDDSWKYEPCSRLIAKAFDVMATTYTSAMDKSVRDGLGNFMMTQWAANSKSMNNPLPSSQCRYKVSFVGSAYGNRLKWIDDLKKAGIEVDCFGYGWPAGAIDADDIPGIMRESVICLNFGDSGVVWNGLLPERSRQIKARVFEVPGAGGLLMTESAENLSDYYLPGQEIIVFDSLEELIDRIHELLEKHDKRDQIAKQGYERTMLEHTYETRFKSLFASAEKIKKTHKKTGQSSPAEFESFAKQHAVTFPLKLFRSILLLPCQLIWGKQRGARAARRLLFEVSWRLSGDKTYRASSWVGRLFYLES